MERDLKNVLSKYQAQAQPWGEPAPLGNAGGLSGSQLWRYESGLGSLVVRAWPVDGPPPVQLDRVHSWLREASRLGFIPVPIHSLDGRTYTEASGRLWEVTPWLPGEADLRRPPSLVRLRAGFVALAVFHQSLALYRVSSPSPGILLRLDELKSLMQGGLIRIESTLETAIEDELRSLSHTWVAAVRKLAPSLIDELTRASSIVIERQPILRDARPEHLLFEGNRVTGLVDFGAMGIDTVAADLARLISEWLDPQEASLRSEAMIAYESIRPLSPDQHMLFHAMIRSTLLLGPGRWVQWHYGEGKVFNDPDAISRGLRRGMDRLTASTSARILTSR